jgi:hypothetical protein
MSLSATNVAEMYASEVLGQQNMTVLQTLCSPAFVDYDPSNRSGDVAGIMAMWQMAIESYTDLAFELTSLSVNDNDAIIRGRMSFSPIGTARQYSIGMNEKITVIDGAIVARRAYYL